MLHNELIQLLNTFTQICETNNFFYSLARETALSVYKNDNVLQNQKVADVFMNIDDYFKLRSLHPDKFIDSLFTNEYQILMPRMMIDKGNWKTTDVYLNILILVPTKITKISNYSNLIWKLSATYGYYNSNNEKAPWYFFIYKFLAKINSSLIHQINIKAAINNLYEDEYEGFLAISYPNENPKLSWIPHVTFETNQYEYQGHKFKLINEIELHFQNYFGENWKNLTEKSV
ncbi:hypothetical protein EI74_0489 [Mycoplasma testudineum]|uniref:Uncharacterized protein n=1 Tax=Mycoplasma testudineum TaxID=244584 RepID=A0A4R6IFB3_9MOLU|nr:hypothetical protein [Mycoplasma testudineum]OYD26876.1 hypothetical protein CG473_02065 [Mycoplasma testudineum]TDO20411.1 hypothetical protein EI74_0489 [Mycoplasma testudineum]